MDQDSTQINSPFQFGNVISKTQTLWPGLDKVQTEDRIVSVIPIKSIKNDNRDKRISFRSYMDRQRVDTYGIPTGFRKNEGLYVFAKLVVDGSHMYNLANINEAKEFAIVSNSPYIEDSPNRVMHIPVQFKVYDPEKEANKNVNTFALVVKYGQALTNLPKDDFMDLCLIILGNGALTQSHTINMNMMLERLQKSPFEIGKKIDNRKQSEVEAIFTRAFAMNMIRLDTTLGYITENGAALGMNKQSAMTKLSQLPEVMRVMDYESRNKLRNNVKFVGVENKPPTQEEILQQHILNSRTKDASFIPAMN